MEAAGFDYEIDEEAQRAGVLRLRVTLVVDGDATTLIATYPDLYPYFRFEVQAPDWDLGRHQNPFTHALCLVGRRTANWNVTDSLAAFLQDRIPLVVETATAPSSVRAAEVEEHQGEPVTAYFTYHQFAVVLVDGGWDLGGVDGGAVELGVPEQAVGPQVLRGAVLSVSDGSGAQVAVADARLARLFPLRVPGRWVRLDRAPRSDGPEGVTEAIVAADPTLAIPRWARLYGTKFDVVGAVFPTEVQWRQCADSWIFVVRVVTQRAVGAR